MGAKNLDESLRPFVCFVERSCLEDDLSGQLNMARVSDGGVASIAREQAAEVAIIRVVGEMVNAIRVSVREVEHLDAELEADLFGDLRHFVE